MLELSCIVVAAAAGLRLGWALVEPGPRTRAARRCAARRGRRSGSCSGRCRGSSLAGLVEGFVTPAGLDSLAVVLPLGLALGALYWGLVAGDASAQSAPAPSPQVRADAGAGEPLGARLDDGRARRAHAPRGARARREHVERDRSA